MRRPLVHTAKLAEEITASNAAAALPESQALKFVEEALSRPEGLNFEGLKNLRTFVGEQLDNPTLLPAGTSKKDVKRVFGALSKDLRNIVEVAGDPAGRGLKAFEKANAFTKRQSVVRKSLNKLLGRDLSDEQIFEKIIRMANRKGGNAKLLGRVRGAVNKETWDDIGSVIIDNMGRDTAGDFVPSVFARKFAGMSNSGKKLIFGRTGNNKIMRDLNDIATITNRSSRLNSASTKPSDLLLGATGGSILISSVLDPFSTAGAVIGVSLLSKMLASPRGVGVLAKYVRFADRFRLKGTGRALFENSARALAAEAAALSGDPNQSSQFEQQLLGNNL